MASVIRAHPLSTPRRGRVQWAFDLIELNGNDLRRDPLAVRKATLVEVLARASPGLLFNEHLDEEDGPLVYEHACKLGLEGIVSKIRLLELLEQLGGRGNPRAGIADRDKRDRLRSYRVPRQFLRRAAGVHQLDHLPTEFRCVGWSRLRHRGLLEHKCSGVHETGSTST
jgi:hypothetical protein